MANNIIHRLHDRSGRSFRNSSRREAQLLPSDHIDVLVARIAKLERNQNVLRSDLDKSLERIRDLKSEISVLYKKVAETMNKNKDEQEVTQQTNSVIKSFSRIGRLLKRRTSVEKLKAKNIYKNEACFDTEIESVVKHPKHPNVPRIVVECAELIEVKARQSPTDGLYRISGDCVQIQQIRFNIDNDDYGCLRNVKDIHTLAGVLKLFLREIKSPLISGTDIRQIVGCDIGSVLKTYNIEEFQKLMESLPEVNRDTLCYFLKHLHKLSRMSLPFTTTASLAVSIGPSLFQVIVDYRKDIGTHIKENVILNNCLEFMIDNYDKIFKLTGEKLTSTKVYRKLVRSWYNLE